MKSVSDWLESSAANAPAALALLDGERQLGFGELLSSAKALAGGLRASGLRPRERVVLLLDKSFEAVAAIHAVLRSGCAYVPLSPAEPVERLADALDTCRPRLVIVRDERAVGERLRSALSGATVVTLQQLQALSATAHEVPRADELGSPAAVLMTSGSTGKPKGVVITHANLAAFTAWGRDAFVVTGNDRLLSHAPLEFDLSFFDLFVACAARAATLLTTPRALGAAELCARVRAAGVTIWQSVPSAIALLGESCGRGVKAMPQVRAVLFAGERMPRPTLVRCKELFPNARLYNIYGATETNDTFMYSVPDDLALAPDPLPIGRPLPLVRYRIVDDAGVDVAPGAAGQLLVSAPTSLAGYLRAGAEFEPAPSEFSTRDLCSLGPDGEARFLGRVDSVLKSNGFRVNALEVEDQLCRCEAVAEAAVLAVPDAKLGTRMVAVVCLKEGNRSTALELRVHCAKRLPGYAIPHQFEIVRESLPTNSNGKVDKRSLTLKYG